ncbi:TIGR02281 family clan AA aspartic protease [Chitinibacter sp. S2-10]|uniref:retropepsin-like aspartic protease family protein n=1 Tax=Chitinibacter sp. S2-10 TaxID=3373597 RepID=UPI0039772F4C
MRSTSSIVILWLLVMAVIYWSFNTLVLQPQRTKAMQITVNATEQLRLKRSRDGHFRINGSLNGQAVVFLIDTGASSVTLEESLARQLKLPRGQSVNTQTANGMANAYLTTIDEMTLGGTQLNQVGAIVVPELGGTALLGMNVLQHFDIQINGNEMLIKPATR